jgi:deazaflavin-dependent oxidoreductase (nitroreductase family)
VSKQYEANFGVRLINALVERMIYWNLGPKHMYILTVKGRKTGKTYSTPVSLVEEAGKRWLVSPYGEVSWLKNARAAGEVVLSRGGRDETYFIHELDAQESAPILKTYINREAIVRPYFDAQIDSSLEAFAAEADRHPVFLLEAK